jgi:hypothetical protein
VKILSLLNDCDYQFSVCLVEIGPLCPTLLPEVTELFQSHFRLASLGVKDEPTLTQAFDVLLENINELLKTTRRATCLFNYLSGLEGRTSMFIERVSQLSFIPCEGHLVKPTEVFIRSTTPVTSVDTAEEEHIDTRGLIDFGSQANSFLLGIGVRSFPSATVLAQLLVDRQAAYFTDSTNNISELGRKQQTYLYCLKQLATSVSFSHELMLEPIQTRLRGEPWCLGYQMVKIDNGETERICKIVTPQEVYLDDDHSLALDVNPLCSPEEPLLTDLYKRFGSRWLSECAQRVMIHTGVPSA